MRGASCLLASLASLTSAHMLAPAQINRVVTKQQPQQQKAPDFTVKGPPVPLPPTEVPPPPPETAVVVDPKPGTRIIHLFYGQPAVAVDGLVDVLDSRCPMGVMCIVAGGVAATVTATENGVASNITLASSAGATTNATTPILGYVLEIRSVQPPPPSPSHHEQVDAEAAAAAGASTAVKASSPLMLPYDITVVVTMPTHERVALNQARARWVSAFKGVSTTGYYSMVQSRSCFCIEEVRRPVKLTVDSSDNILSAVYAEAPYGQVSSDYMQSYKTVEGLFDIIQEAIDRGAASIQVEYDAVMGYPATMYIDLDVRMADEEISYTVLKVDIDADPTTAVTQSGN